MKTYRYIVIVGLVFLNVIGGVSLLAGAGGDEQKYIATLRSDASLFEKSRACQELAVCGTKRAVPVLATLLDDGSLGDYARIALEGIDDSSVDDALRNAMGELKGKQLTGVINSVGVRRDARSVPILKTLVGSSDMTVADAAVSALGCIATDEAVGVVLGLLKSDSQAMRECSANACLASAGQMPAGRAIKLYDAVIKAEVPTHLRGAAVYNAIIVRRSAGLPMLVELLRSDDGVMIDMALGAVRRLPSSGVTEKLVAELPKLEPAIQVLVIDALAERNDPCVRQGIMDLAASEDVEVRIASLKALGKVGRASSVGIMIKSLGVSGEEASVTAESLVMLNGDRVDAAIMDGVRAAKGQLRAELIDILAKRRVAAALPLMRREAANEDEAVAVAAFKALRQLSEPKDIAKLVSLLVATKNDRVRGYGETAVAAVALKMEDESKRCDEVIAAFNATDEAGVRCSLLRALGNVPNDKSFAILKRSAVDEDGDICDAAIRALAVWPDQRAMGILSEMAFKSSDSKNRVIALRGYIRLVGVDVELSLEEKVEIYSRAIRGASGDNEKKLILAGLANVEHFTALETVAAYLDEPAVAEEACLAAVRIARATAGVMPARVRLAAQRVKGTAKSERTRSQADEIIRAINRFGDHIVAWQVCGPYAKDGLNYSRLFDEVFAPEIAGGDVKWSLLPIDVSNPKPWILDLLKLYPGQQRAAYVRTTIHSKSKQRAVLEIGKDDGIKVWLNGKVVHSSNTAGAVTPGADKVNIVLEQGSNSLMLKVTQNTSAWGFCARLVNPAGGKVEGVTVDCCGEQEMSTIDKSGAGKAVSIFDGRSFAGWEGNLDAFRIEDGAIVGGTLKEKIPRNEFLCSEKQYGDFELRLKVKLLGDNANAGIQIRSRRIPNHHEVIGYQADMGQQYWGCLYDESRRRKVLAWADKAEVAKVLKPGDWNDYTIRCEGKRIGLWINGYKTVDYVEADESVEQVGVIGLQIHSGGASEAWYKDITLKELQ